MPTDLEIDAALEAVVTAARNHRAVLRSAAATDEEIWTAYVALNNASVHYDDLINRAYDEVTPWDCEYVEDNAVTNQGTDLSSDPLRRGDFAAAAMETLTPEDTPAVSETGKLIVAVRHRRDYLVNDIQGLLAAANVVAARTASESPTMPITHIGQALYTLVEGGDGTLATLDEFDELEPENGVLLINQIRQTITPEALDADPEVGFQLSPQERLLYRLDEVIVADEEATHSTPAGE